MNACPRLDDAIAYSLRRLTPQEEQAFRAHLEVCAACRLALAEVQETVDLLPLAAPPVTPPSGLKDRVLTAVAAEAARDRAHRARPYRALLTATAVLAASVALVIGSYALLRVEALQQWIAGFQQAAPVEQTIPMVGTEEAPGATGRVVIAREGSGVRIALQATGLPPLRPGEAYQLWLIKDGQRRSGGVFVVDATGQGGVATWLPEPVQFDALGITREPDALGTQPRGPKVMGSAS